MHTGVLVTEYTCYTLPIGMTSEACAVQVEVQEAYGKQSSQRYPLDPPDPKSVTGEDASTHNRGMGGPLAKLPLSVQPGEVVVQVSFIKSH